MDGLAENILLELLPCLKDGRFGIFSQKGETRLRRGLFSMMAACRLPEAAEILNEKVKIGDGVLYKYFSVGTEQKKGHVRAPDPNLLGSITSLNEHMLKSVEQRALERTGKREIKNKPKEQNIYTFEPNYLKVSTLLEIIGIDFESDKDMPIGTRLINHRAEIVKKKTSVKAIANIYFDLKKGWKCLVESGRDRGRATKK